MSKGQTLKALVNERLAAAAEDIFLLFERTIAEFQEELCRSKEQNQMKQQNQRKQQLLDTVLYPRIELVRGNFQIPSTSSDPSLDQDTQTPWIKEELGENSVKQEKEQLPAPVPDCSDVFVTTEESLLLEQRQTELREETQGEDISPETEGHTDNDDDWGALLSYSAAQMETEADGDHYNQVQIRDTSLCSLNQSAPQTAFFNRVMLEANIKKHQCPFCQKRFGTKQSLQIHIRVHTGEKPYGCPICKKHFTQKHNLDKHKKLHTGENPFSFLLSKMTFASKSSLDLHRMKPFSCSICKKTFIQKSSLEVHARKHTGERPYSCAICNKHFADPSAHRRHLKMHTGEKPYSCDICEKSFARKYHLKTHMRVHSTGTQNVAAEVMFP